ncbi:MAG: hypothetical protein IJC71_05040 [Clostridia bacterium]|nr:hypothetical protein [Clostridia bacterium]
MLLPLLLGTAAFLLFFLYDVNSITGRFRLFRTFFLAGCILLVLSTVLCLLPAWKMHTFGTWADMILLLLGALSLAALIYTLFFALPFEKTYVTQDEGRKVYDRGVYALCRHPGVLFFFAAYLFFGLAAHPSPLLPCGMIFSVLNLGYVWFQDRVTFVKTFDDYEDYKKRVPFIIPTPVSIRQMCTTWRRTNRKEDSK